MRPVHAIAKISKRQTVEESLDASSHLVKHYGHCDKSLHRHNSRFVKLYAEVLNFAQGVESCALRGQYSRSLAKVTFGAGFSIDFTGAAIDCIEKPQNLKGKKGERTLFRLVSSQPAISSQRICCSLPETVAVQQT
jgi:hypothetical protein